MPVTVGDLLKQIGEYHLMPSKDYMAMRNRWLRPGRAEVDDVARFRDWLRVNHYVTDFDLAALLEGKADKLTLNQYRLTDVIRTGPQAGDFQATDPVERQLRVSIFAPAISQDAAAMNGVRDLGQKAMILKHPGVARVLDMGQAQKAYYAVSEYVDGETLEEKLQKRAGKLQYNLAARVFAVAFDSVAALHQNEVSPVELTAETIVFAKMDKAAGGGVVPRLVNAFFSRSLFDSSILGIFRRQAESRGHPAKLETGTHPAEDILRLGRLFYRSIVGQDPFGSEDVARPARKVSIKTSAPDTPEMLADLIDAMIDPEPANRPQSAAGIAKSLRVFLRTEEQTKESDAEEEMELEVVATAAPEAEAISAVQEEAGEPEINRLFRAVVKFQGSDLHLVVGRPPSMRVNNLVRAMTAPPLTEAEMERLTAPIINERSKKILDETGGADFAHVLGGGGGRFRVNVFKQRGQISLVARRVNAKIPSFEQLNLPPVIEKLCHFEQGIVIIAGVTGSGKSTTLAAMLDYINEHEQVHILTVEDPIEYLFTPKKAAINQREVGIDVIDWHTALKHAVRQDPDVILVGEMRDQDTFEAGIHAAETGHLVFGTIHSSTAPSTIGRILDLFPADMHAAMRQSLAFNLKAIVCQKLLPGLKPGAHRVPSNEIMIVNPTIRELIIRGDDKKLPDAIRLGRQEGMIDFNENLYQLVARGDIDATAALEVSPNPEALKMILQGIRVAASGIL
jgi:twitching motility protein PilT